MARANDLTGQTFGNLTIMHRVESDANGKAQWLAACTCGRTRTFLALNLKAGRTRSCGECQAAHGTGIDAEQGPRYHITVWSGPNSPSGKPYCFGEVRDAQGALVFRTTPPVNRETTKGELHAGATRCMYALVTMEHIAPVNGRTFKRWANEERVTIDIKGCSTEEETMERWYEVTGEPRPVREGAHAQQGARTGYVLPELTADQRAGLDSLFKDWGID